MISNQQWSEVVKRLAEQTYEGKVAWMVAPSVYRDGALGDIYEAAVKGRRIICYEYRYRSYTGAGSSYPEPDSEDWEWETDVAIEFVDALGNLQWRFPETPHHTTLLDAIRFRAAGADRFLEEYLKES